MLYENVEPPPHQTLEADELTPVTQPLQHLPRPAGEKAVEWGPYAHRNSLEPSARSPLAVVLSVHPGYLPEGGWPVIRAAPF